MPKKRPHDSVTPYNPPDFAIRLAERRTGEMIRIYQHHQADRWRFQGSQPVPTLSDLVTSALPAGH
jgi:hypothetical protein